MDYNGKRAALREKKAVINWPLLGHDLFRVALALIAALLVFIMISNTIIKQERHSFEVGAVATEDIYAPRTAEDTAQTEQARAVARDAVGMSYSEDPAITQKVLADIENCFVQMQQVRAMGEAERERMRNESVLGLSGSLDYSSDFLAQCNEEIPGVALSESALIGLLDMLQTDFDTLSAVTLEQANTALLNGIKQDQLSDQLAFIGRNLRAEDSSLTEEAQRIAVEVVNDLVQANFLYDEEATENARAQAAEKVEPVMIRAGESIVRRGDVLTEEQYSKLSALGMLESHTSDASMYVALAVLILLIFAIGGMYLFLFDRDVLEEMPKYAVLLSVVLLSVLLFWLGRKLSYMMMPLIAATLLSMLLNRRVAYIMNVLLAALAALMAGEPGAALSSNALPVFTAVTLAGTLSINMLTTRSQRGTVMLCGLTSAGVYLLVFSVCQMLDMSFMDFVKTRLFSTALYSLSAGIGSAIIVLGSFIVWESVFGMVTPMKLLELTNPNQPLLHQLLLEAPGTHHHSVVVSNLAESAAEAVGANPMLARCGAMYHDIGKLRRPTFFKENQIGMENPHDQIDPTLSARILISHVLDGKEMAEKNRLPKEVVRIISGHHGDTLAAYFYAKAKNNAQDPNTVREEDYRYPGPVPTSKEESIVMLADSVEAAVRSMPTHTPDGMEEMVRKIVRGKREDGQLDTCDLTFGEIETITRVFLKSLSGIYHERIQYPPVAGEKK